MNATAIRKRQRRATNRAVRYENRHGGYYAFFSQEAFDLEPTLWMHEDGRTSYVSRGNVYLRQNGTPVRITAVFHGSSRAARTWARGKYLWNDTQSLGRVASWDHCILHSCDPRFVNPPVKWGSVNGRWSMLSPVLCDEELSLN